MPTIGLARQAFAAAGLTGGLSAAGGDVRDLPFANDSFDAIYSMGTIEHFAETERAVAEMARVLKPGDAPSSACRIGTIRSCGR